VIAWRGIRSASNAFGVPTGELSSLAGQTLRPRGLLAVTVRRAIAVDQFTVPPLSGGPVLVELRIPAGTPAAWISLAGAPALRGQHELLLRSRTRLEFGELTYDDDLPILSAEVVN